MRKKVGVLIHGFHLQAENWGRIVWGEPPNFLGRVPKGMLVAIEERAEIIVFGTGASEKDGKKEAEYIRDYLLEHFLELAEFSAFQGLDLEKARKKIEKVSRLELKSQNTPEEIKLAGQIFKEAGIEKIILVSSPTHISRCLRDACAVLAGEDLSAKPSQTSWADPDEVIIIEPPHRPDRPKSNLHGFVKELMKMPKQEQEELIKKALT